VAEFAAIGGLVADVLDGMAGDAAPGTAAEASQKVRALCRDFPIYPDLASCPSS
jgi:hypothetical protein